MSEKSSVVGVQINGELREIPADQTLTELIADLGLTPQTALVEHKGVALFREDWNSVKLAAGDRLEILRVVAGG